MTTAKVFYYLSRLKALGLVGVTTKFGYKLRQKKFIATWKQRVHENQANHTWQQISATQSFEYFFAGLKTKNVMHDILHDKQFKALLPTEYTNQATILRNASQAAASSFSILGSRLTTFATTIAWHDDFKTNTAQDLGFQKTHHALGASTRTTFYHDIKINPPKNPSLDEYHTDIKVPWELSRMQHLFFLGQAYRLTGDEQYVHTFTSHVTSWIDDNPALLGVNWVCAMDVGIRAINLVWGYYFFHTAPSITQPFWEKLTCSLYDHLIYLENNWEYSDKPNNHYLAELLGYQYLCSFLENLPGVARKKKWATKKLWHAFEQQVQPDGTSYEGSTSYHRLITEMYLHFLLLCNHQTLLLPSDASQKLNQMVTFLQNSTDDAGNLAQIGDNDSGKIVTGIRITPTTDNHTTTYPDFGLTIIKHHAWHMTLRHPAFSEKKPSGHLHHDAWSITLSLGTIPILIDPGSYLYTANSTWRNLFRSAANHSTFYVTNTDCSHAESELFQLSKPCHLMTSLRRTITIKGKQVLLEDWHEHAHRNTEYHGHWTFMFHPEITLKADDTQTWIIMHHEKPIAVLTSSLNLELAQGFYAPAYGVRLSCQKLTKSTIVKTPTISHTIQQY